MVIQDILAFLKKEMTQMREEISEEISAMKSIFADEEEGSAYPKFQERRGKDEKFEEFDHPRSASGKDEKFEEFDHPRSASTIDQSIAYESSGKTFVNNDDIDDDTNVNDDIGQEYHQYHDDNDIYDTDEILDNRHDTIEGDNPHCNVTNNLSLIDKVTAVRSTANIDPEKIFEYLCNADIEEEKVSIFSNDNNNNTPHSNVYRGGLYIPDSPVIEMQSSRNGRGNKIAVTSIWILQITSLIKVYDPGKCCTCICTYFSYFNSTIKIALLS
jgi:hypothetical protein